MGAYFGGFMIYFAIMVHGCDVVKSAEIQAAAIRDAAKSCQPQPQGDR